MPHSGSSLCKILEKQGFHKVRQHGSHIIMQKKLGTTTMTVVVPDHKEIRPGTLQSIIRQSRLPKSYFE